MTLLERLVLENQILERDGLSQFQVHRAQHGESYYLWGVHRTNAGNAYTIWSPIPIDFPNTRPPVYVHEPNPLPGYRYGESINGFGLSHALHTLSNGPNGEVQICHWRDERWHSGITLNKVMLKIVLWLEGYEQYRTSGTTISELVRTMA